MEEMEELFGREVLGTQDIREEESEMAVVNLATLGGV